MIWIQNSVSLSSIVSSACIICLLEVLHRRAYIWYGLRIVWRFGAQGSDIKDTIGIEKFSGIIVY
jgi:hypothetical protein